MSEAAMTTQDMSIRSCTTHVTYGCKYVSQSYTYNALQRCITGGSIHERLFDPRIAGVAYIRSKQLVLLEQAVPHSVRGGRSPLLEPAVHHCSSDDTAVVAHLAMLPVGTAGLWPF